MPYILLGIRQLIGKTFYDLLSCPNWLHRKCIGSFFCLLLQKLYCQHKEQKFIKYQSFPCSKKLLHILWKMNGTDCIIIICKLISFPYLLRQIFSMKRSCIQNLMYQLRDCLIGKTFRQPVYRLHAVNDLLICCRGKNLRMFHLQTSFFPCDLSSQNEYTSFFQSSSEIRRIEPGHRKTATGICHSCC